MKIREFFDKFNHLHPQLIPLIVGDSVVARTKVSAICHLHGTLQKQVYRWLRGDGCRKCGQLSQRQTKEEFAKTAIKKFPYLLDWWDFSQIKYEGRQKKINPICKKCNQEKFVWPDDVACNGARCFDCFHRTLKKPLENFMKESQEKFGWFSFPNFKYITGETYTFIYCQKHNYEFSAMPKNHLISPSGGCPVCSATKTEKMAFDILREMGYSDVRIEHKFKNCKIKELLLFDLFIPSLNLVIEVDGPQHKKPVFGPEKFLQTITNDKIKETFCLTNGIFLERIAANVKTINQDINQIIKKYATANRTNQNGTN